jgi:hypothetical protein
LEGAVLDPLKAGDVPLALDQFGKAAEVLVGLDRLHAVPTLPIRLVGYGLAKRHPPLAMKGLGSNGASVHRQKVTISALSSIGR